MPNCVLCSSHTLASLTVCVLSQWTSESSRWKGKCVCTYEMNNEDEMQPSALIHWAEITCLNARISLRETPIYWPDPLTTNSGLKTRKQKGEKKEERNRKKTSNDKQAQQENLLSKSLKKRKPQEEKIGRGAEIREEHRSEKRQSESRLVWGLSMCDGSAHSCCDCRVYLAEQQLASVCGQSLQ